MLLFIKFHLQTVTKNNILFYSYFYPWKLWKPRKFSFDSVNTTFHTCKMWKKDELVLAFFLEFTPVNYENREKIALVLLLQITPLNCTKQDKSVLVLLIQFTTVNYGNREKFALVLLLHFMPVKCTKQCKSVLVLLIQFTPINCEKRKVCFGPSYTNYTYRLWKNEMFVLILSIQFTNIWKSLRQIENQ